MKDKMKGLYKEAGADDRKKLREAWANDAEMSKAFDEVDAQMNKSLSFDPDALDELLKSIQAKVGQTAAAGSQTQAPDILAGTSASQANAGFEGVDPDDTGTIDPLPVFENIAKSLGEQNEAIAFTRKGIVALAQRAQQERDLLAKAIGQMSDFGQALAAHTAKVDALQKSVDGISTRLGLPSAAPRGVTTQPTQVLPTRADAATQTEQATQPAPDAVERIEKSLNLAMAQGNGVMAGQLRQMLLLAQDGHVTEAHLQQAGIV